MSEEINEIVEEVVETSGVEEIDFERVGNVKISIDVVATIAGVAATACEGVYAMAGSLAGDIAEKFGAKKNPSKGVKVEMTDTEAAVDLYIVVKYGVRIPELAWEIQESVKNNIESMTGLIVEKVNIHIEGVNFDEEPTDDNEVKKVDVPADEVENAE